MEGRLFGGSFGVPMRAQRSRSVSSSLQPMGVQKSQPIDDAISLSMSLSEESSSKGRF